MPGPLIPLSETASGLELVINGVYVTHEPAAAWPSSRLRENLFSHIIYVDRRRPGSGNCADDENTSAGVDEQLDPNEFECLELNFNSALVLPNLYKSDKFIAKALQNDGKVMIIEPNSSCQKCIAIILGYFMCNFELSFWHAYETLRKLYRPKFELDRFLIMQLYEYEPILKVRRAAEEMGHSFQSQRLRSVLKRSSCALDSSYEEQARGEEVNDDEREEETTRLPQGRSLALPGEETMVE